MPISSPTDESKGQEIVGRVETGDALLHVQRETLRSLDFTNALMVAATILMAIGTMFSAWTSWRVARLTRDFYSTSNRPYLGVASIKLDRSNPERPASWIEFRNFGNIPSEQTVIEVSTLVNGRLVKDILGLQHVVLSLGLLSPEAPYFFGAMFPPQYLQSVENGSTKLVVIIESTYRDMGGRLHCYHMRYAYVAFLDKYDPDGGSSACTAEMPVYSAKTVWERVVPRAKN